MIQLTAVVSALPLNLKINQNPNGADDSIDDIVSLLKLRVDSEEVKRGLRSLLEKTNARRQEIIKPATIESAERQIHFEENYYDYDEDADGLQSATDQHFIPTIHEENELLMQSDITDTVAGNEDVEFLRQYRQAAYDDLESLRSADQMSYGQIDMVDADELDDYY